jgi:TonB family protein
MRKLSFILSLLALLGGPSLALAQGVEFITDRPDVPAAIPTCSHMPDMYRDNCNRSKLQDHFKKHLVYPESARARGVEGEVGVVVVIDTLGQMNATRLSRRGDPDLDAEALRVVKLLSEGGKTWSPGMVGDRKVISEYRINVPFQLEQPDIRRILPAAPSGAEK